AINAKCMDPTCTDATSALASAARKCFIENTNSRSTRSGAHGIQPSSFRRASPAILGPGSETEERYPRPQRDMAVINGSNDGEVGSTGAMAEHGALNREQDLRAKLQSLKVTRAELDEDIGCMERALSIMAGTLPQT